MTSPIDVRGPHIEVSAQALLHNVRAIRNHLGASTAIAAVLKANAYGHGLRDVARVVADEVEWLAVAEPDDAIALSDVAPGRVLCLGPIRGADLRDCVHARVRCTIDSKSAASELAADAVVHLLVDTGLHRLGAAPGEIAAVRREAMRRGATVEAVFCMAAGAEIGDWELVEQEVALLRSIAAPTELIHTGGTTVALERPDLAGDIARPGLAILGYPSRAAQRERIELQPSLRLIAPVLETRRVPAGARVGYDAVPVARSTIIATLPVGVAHGLQPQADHRTGVWLRDRFCPFLARPSLEYALVDATDVEMPELGEQAVVLGGGPQDPTSVESVARQLGMIVDHVLAALSPALPRRITG
jgi:alanine racemase